MGKQWANDISIGELLANIEATKPAIRVETCMNANLPGALEWFWNLPDTYCDKPPRVGPEDTSREESHIGLGGYDMEVQVGDHVEWRPVETQPKVSHIGIYKFMKKI